MAAETELSRLNVLRLSNDESNKLTREALQIAIIKLLGKTDFDKITITEITRRAGVSRAAFYRNYDSKEQLVEEACSSVFSKLEKSIKGPLYKTDRKTWYRNFFNTIKENHEYFRIYLSAHLKITDQYVLETIFPSSTASQKYLNAAKEGAFTNILTEWFLTGMKESPEEMSELCCKILIFT